jgi:hypothetical protein
MKKERKTKNAHAGIQTRLGAFVNQAIILMSPLYIRRSFRMLFYMHELNYIAKELQLIFMSAALLYWTYMIFPVLKIR